MPFKDKEELALAVLEWVNETWWREVGGPAEQEPDPVAALLALARGHAVYCRRDVARVMMALRVEFSGQDHPVGREIKRVSQTLMKRCARLIEAGRRDGSIPPGPPAKAVALAFWGALERAVIALAGQAPHDGLRPPGRSQACSGWPVRHYSHPLTLLPAPSPPGVPLAESPRTHAGRSDRRRLAAPSKRLGRRGERDPARGSPAMTSRMGDVMAELELSAGSIRYADSGGEGPVVVLCHGLLMTASLWDAVVAELGPGFRCVRPTLPLGAHRRPMRAEADLSLRSQVRLLVEFLERLELEEVTLVFNDWCGAQLLVAEGWDGRVGRLVLASCETYDNYPPGLPGRVAALAARLPGGRPPP